MAVQSNSSWVGAKMKLLPPEMSRFYFACIISAFDALHATGWMHRDLSLKNVWLTIMDMAS